MGSKLRNEHRGVGDAVEQSKKHYIHKIEIE